MFVLSFVCLFAYNIFTQTKSTMARIRSNSVTSQIKGDDARKFRTNLLESLRRAFDPAVRKQKQKELEEMEKDYKFFESISRGAF